MTILAMGVLTYALRLSFIGLLGRHTLQPRVWRALRLVPPAVLAAIIVPALVLPAGQLDLGPDNARLAGGVVAGLVAWRSKNMLLTIGAGMGVLLAWRMLVG